MCTFRFAAPVAISIYYGIFLIMTDTSKDRHTFYNLAAMPLIMDNNKFGEVCKIWREREEKKNCAKLLIFDAIYFIEFESILFMLTLCCANALSIRTGAVPELRKK